MSTEHPGHPAESVLHVGGASPYDVVVGTGLAARLPDVLGPAVERVALIHAGELTDLAQGLLEVLRPRYDVLALGLPSGEEAKTAAVAADPSSSEIPAPAVGRG